jgi:hypothetical protein
VAVNRGTRIKAPAMATYTIRDPTEARRFVHQALCCQRVVPPTAGRVRAALEWTRELASGGEPLPPPGVVADLGHLALGVGDEPRRPADRAPDGRLPINLLRAYEDHVVARLEADAAFERAADALRRYHGRDRARGLAFLLGEFQKRCHAPGVEFSPAVLASLSEARPEDVLGQGWASLERDGPLGLLVDLYEGIVRAVRGSAELVGPEDLFELEHGTALADLGGRVARRQVLQAVSRLETYLGPHPVRSRPQAARAPTHLCDEDAYPVGGFSSLSTRGSVESLLHSQLAYMEKDERPDLFDVKFLREELLYYARDENQLWRRRHVVVFALHPDLVGTRFKDAELPYQRGVVLLALVVLAVRKLTQWLSADSARFQIDFVTRGENDPLGAERALLQTLLSEQVANGTVQLLCEAASQLGPRCVDAARRSVCHCLSIAEGLPPAPEAGVATLRLRVNGPAPMLGDATSELRIRKADTPLESWGLALHDLLREWV